MSNNVLVYADANLFSTLNNTDIPCSNNDIIGFVVPHHKATIMRMLTAKQCKEHARKFRFNKYIVFNNLKQPRYSNFDNEYNGLSTIKIDSHMKRKLLMFLKLNYEVSGTICKTGTIINLKIGDVDRCPYQPPISGCISFHSHPKISYSNYSTTAGWPSNVDMENATENHIIVSMEGLYLMGKKTSTCNPPKKKNLTVDFDTPAIEKMFKRCSWILLPWRSLDTYFVYPLN